MFLTVHGAAALVIARTFPNPLIAFLLSLGSHFILDIVPHGDEFITDETKFSRSQALRRLFGAALFDALILLFFILIYIATTPSLSITPIIYALLGALLPDAMQAIALFVNWSWLKRYAKFHSHLHNLTRHKMHWQEGLFIQVLSFTALWLLLM